MFQRLPSEREPEHIEPPPAQAGEMDISAPVSEVQGAVFERHSFFVVFNIIIIISSSLFVLHSQSRPSFMFVFVPRTKLPLMHQREMAQMTYGSFVRPGEVHPAQEYASVGGVDEGEGGGGEEGGVG